MIIVLILSLPFLYVLARKPVLRRLALRNATRRPRETLLVVLGSLLGTAIMTGSFVVGDTFDASIRQSAYDQLGPIDEIVSVSGLEEGAAVRDRLAGVADENIDGVLPLTLTRAAVATTEEPRRAVPQAQLLETQFAAAREFGDSERATGMSGETPESGEAVIGADLARELRVEPGATIEAFAYGTSVPLQVTRVLPKRGVAGFWRGDATRSNNVFVAPGTIEELAAGATVESAAPPQSLVLISNRGGVIAGDRLTDAVHAALDTRLEGVQHSIENVKQVVLIRADRVGSSLSRLYSSIGAFAVLAGILLLVNIFFMLADERKSELGMLRAVGLRRKALIGAFATEGWCYAVVSAIAGTFVGLLLGRVLMAAASRLFSSRTDDDRLTLHFSFEWASVQRGLVIGFVIAIATIVLTSVRLARFNIIQAIRDINEPVARRPHRRTSYIGLGAAVVGLLLTGVGVAGPSFFLLMVGPVLVMAGITPSLARNMPREFATTLTAAAALVWLVAAVPIAIVLGDDPDVLLFVLQGLLLVGAAVVIVTQHQSGLGHVVARLAPRSFRVRLGLAYPLARKFRTAMTLGMFALVVFILVMVTVFAAMFSGQLNSFTRDVSGGFDTVVDSNASNPVPLDTLAREPGVRAVAPLTKSPVEIVEAPGLTESRNWDASGFDEAFIEHGAPALEDRGTYASDEAAYRAVLADPNLAITEDLFLAARAGPPADSVEVGDQFTAVDPVGGGRRTFTVAGVVPNDFAENGFLVGAPAMRELVGERAVANRAYLDVDNPDAYVSDFAGRYLANGGEAESLRHIVQTELANQNQFFLLMRGYLALGLIVGVAGIGVIMVRAVRERRRQVGVLRALGFQAKAVRGVFVTESAFVAVEGVLIGTVLALVCSWSITLTDGFGDNISFRIPFLGIGLLVIGTLFCTLLATAAPARSASKIDPAVALRIAD